MYPVKIWKICWGKIEFQKLKFYARVWNWKNQIRNWNYQKWKSFISKGKDEFNENIVAKRKNLFIETAKN
jgi:hypothetical protein